MKTIPLVDLKLQYKQIKPEINKAISEVLQVGDYILGKKVEEFEKKFAKYSEAKYCVSLDNGSSALELGMRALGIGEGDEVITPVNSFIASSSAISFTGATPVWVDCDKSTYNLDVVQLESKITKKTKAIMPVHLYGQAANMDAIIKIAKKYKLFIVEDACQAHGARYKGKRVGSFGDIAAFSFYPGKNLGAYGDGGALTTNNKKIYEMVKSMRNYGQKKKYHHSFLGWNRRLDTIQAAVLLVNLKYLDTWNKKRQEKAKIYTKLLKNTPLALPFTEEHNKHVYHLYVVRTKKRDNLKKYLESNGIQVGIHYPIPIHQQEAYKKATRKTESFPVSDIYAGELLSLPIYPELTDKEIQYTCSLIKNFFDETK